jgi:hypothetical protein
MIQMHTKKLYLITALQATNAVLKVSLMENAQLHLQIP